MKRMQKQMRSKKASSVRSQLLRRSRKLSRLTLWWVTADRLLKVTSTTISKSSMYKKKQKTSSSPIMWHRYAKCTIGWLCFSFNRCKKIRGQPQRDRGRTSCEEIEIGTHAHRASKLGPVERCWTQDDKLGITIQDPSPRVWKTGTFIVFYSFVLHSVMCLKTCHFNACFTSLWTSNSVFHVKLHVTSSRFSLYLLNIYHFTYTFPHAHIEHTQAHMYNQHKKRNGKNQAQEPGWEGRKKGVC